MDDKNYVITIQVSVMVPKDVGLKTAEYTGLVVGFRLPDGRIARPILGFEVEGPAEEYVDMTGAETLDHLGLKVWDYITTRIEEEP